MDICVPTPVSSMVLNRVHACFYQFVLFILMLVSPSSLDGHCSRPVVVPAHFTYDKYATSCPSCSFRACQAGIKSSSRPLGRRRLSAVMCRVCQAESLLDQAREVFGAWVTAVICLRHLRNADAENVVHLRIRHSGADTKLVDINHSSGKCVAVLPHNFLRRRSCSSDLVRYVLCNSDNAIYILSAA